MELESPKKRVSSAKLQVTVPSLYDIAAKSVGIHVGCEILETANPPLDENTLKKVACSAFPVNETHIKLISELTTFDKSTDWTHGVDLYLKGCVNNIRQVGFMVAATVLNLDNTTTDAKVTITFERRRITCTKCSQCRWEIWCPHIVSVIVARIRNASKVPIQAPVTDILLSLTREQLQKIIQYAVDESPGDMLCRIFSYIDAVRDPRSRINRMKGYPDPTFGVHTGDKTTDQLSLEQLRRNLDDENLIEESHTNQAENCSLTDHERFMTSTQTGKERYLQTAILLLQQNDIDLAGRAFIQMAQYLHDSTSESRTTATKKMMLDVERWFSFFIASFSGQIRHDMLTAALDINKRSVFLELNDGSEMRCVKLQSIGDSNNNASGTLMGENRFVSFYEPVVANFLPKIPASLSDLYDNTVLLKLNSYKEPLDVMLFRFEKLVHIDKYICGNEDVAEIQICLLGIVILQKLMRLTDEFSILGGSTNKCKNEEHVKDCLDVDMTKVLPVTKEVIPVNLLEVNDQPNQNQMTDDMADLWWERRQVIGHLSNLIHAYKCQQEKTGTCKDPVCVKMKGILGHIRCCTDRGQCKYTNCYSTKLILEHWNSCDKNDCRACSDIWECEETHHCSPFCGDSKLCNSVRRTYCSLSCNEDQCCMCAAAKTGVLTGNDDYVCPHYTNLLLGKPCDDDICIFCQHINTRSRDRLNDKSRLCGDVKCRLCSRSLWDSTNMNTEYVTLFMFAYDPTYRSAQTALGLSGSGADIHSEFEDHTKTIAASTRKKKTKTEEIRWKEKTSLEFRNHLINKFVQTLLPVSSQNGDRFISAVAFSTRLEQQVFDKAKSKVEYFHLLVDKMYQIKKEIPVVDRRKERGKGKSLTQDEDYPSFAKRRKLSVDSLEDEEILYEGLTKKQLLYSLLYISVQVFGTKQVSNNRTELAITFSAAFRAFEFACLYNGGSEMEESWTLLKTKLVSEILPYRKTKMFEIVSHMYACVLKGKKRHIPLTLVSFLTKYGNLSMDTRVHLAYEALTESLFPYSRSVVKHFNGSAEYHYNKLMEILFQVIGGTVKWKFLLHLRNVQDKQFVITAMDYFMQINNLKEEDGKIILDILLKKLIGEKWVLPTETGRVEKMIETFGVMSLLIPVTFTTQILSHWSQVCAFFSSLDDLERVIRKVYLAVTIENCPLTVAHPLIENYLAEDCKHDVECCSLMKIFYSSKDDVEKVVDKIEGNQTKYTHVCLMKITKFVQKTTRINILSCQASRRCMLMALEACIRSLRTLPDIRPEYLQLYQPSAKENKYFSHFFQLIISSLTEDIITTSQFREFLVQLKKVLVMNVSLMLEFLTVLDQSEIGKRERKNWLGNSLIECYSKAFMKDVETTCYQYYSSIVQELRAACSKCEMYAHNGKTNFVCDVVNEIKSCYARKKKLCSMINEEFSR